MAGTNWITYTGGALLTAGAVTAFTRAEPGCWNRPIGAWLCACGHASLSIYLLASMLLAAVAQGWGFGLHGRLDPHQTAAVTLCVMAIAAWFGLTRTHRTHQAPPLEQAWRLGTRLLSGGRPRPETPPTAPSRAERRRDDAPGPLKHAPGTLPRIETTAARTAAQRGARR